MKLLKEQFKEAWKLYVKDYTSYTTNIKIQKGYIVLQKLLCVQNDNLKELIKTFYQNNKTMLDELLFKFYDILPFSESIIFYDLFSDCYTDEELQYVWDLEKGPYKSRWIECGAVKPAYLLMALNDKDSNYSYAENKKRGIEW